MDIVRNDNSIRKKIYNVIEPRSNVTKASSFYDVFMIITICCSLIPSLFKQSNMFLTVLDLVTVSIFIVDYILRLITADYKYDCHSVKSFIRYPFSGMAIIDLLSILPSLAPVNSSLRALRLLRLIRALRVFRVIKGFRYSKNFEILGNVFQKQKKSLIAVLCLAIGYIFVSAYVIFQIEPDTFDDFFDALYWATISLTTVGYGDLYAVSPAGQFITMLSALAGIAVVALPAGIVTAGYLEELSKDKD